VQSSCDLKVSKKHCKFTRKVEQVPQKDTSVISWNSRKERTVEILRGDFANHREPLDLAEVQGGYGEYFSSKGSKLRRGRAIDPTTRTVGSTRDIVYRGFVSRSSKLLQQELRNREARYPDEPRTIHCLGRVSEDPKKSGFGVSGV
jgi:hypothetical protein